LLSGGLLVMVFGSLVYGLGDAIQGIERGLLWPIVLIGLFLGWGLACSPLSTRLSALVSLLAGVVLVLLRVGQFGGPLLRFLGEFLGLVGQTLRDFVPPGLAPPGIVPPDVSTVQAVWAELIGGGGALIARSQAWLLSLLHGRPVFDPVPIALVWGLAVWASVLWAAWLVWRRAQPLLGVTPAVTLLAAALAWVGGRTVYLLPMLAAALVLKALLGHEVRSRRWQQSGLRLSPRVRPDTVWMASGVSLALVVVAALTPSVSVYRIAELIRGLSVEQAGEGEFARSLGLEPKSVPARADVHLLDARRAPGLPTRHLIGSGPELADRLIMVVGVESGPGDARNSNRARQPLYWRGLTYGRYTERGWSTQYEVRIKYPAGESALPVPAGNHQLMRQHVSLVRDGGGLVYAAGSLVTTDRDYQVAWRTQPGPEQPGDIFGATVVADSYRADSLLPDASEEALRSAGQGYPAWVTERYLEVPDSVPARVVALARDLTATETTPYDRARAIEDYLRGFPYTLDLPAPPVGRDLVDYFLFDLQRGYCDYYASAMVVLARAAGLPARLTTGYLSGTYDEAEGAYLVSEDQAHAWAEVYFPGHGWISFEPTAGRPALERPEAPATATVQGTAEPLEPITATRTRQQRALWLGVAGGALALAFMAGVVWWLVDGWRVRRMPPDLAVPHLYRRLYGYGWRLGAPPRAGDTPHEFAAALEMRLAALRHDRRWGSLLDTVPEEVRWLADLCARALYAPRRTCDREREAALHCWRRMRVRLWLVRLAA
jgi:transglutaminase-like putative cysteine protease